jgi:hypothetical protein
MNRTGKLQFGYYVVCLVDVLGQKERLAGWRELPSDDGLRGPFIAAIKKSVGTVVQIREMFEDYFRAVADRKPPILFAQHQELWQRLNESKLNVQQFSDTCVFYAPVTISSGEVSVTALQQMLGACSAVMLVSLAAGTPLRGAVTVGVGTELADRDLYGPVLAEAYYLENRVAEYPRIVVSRHVLEFLHSIRERREKHLYNQGMRLFADFCLSLLCDDTDGKLILDFLGKAARDASHGAGSLRQVIDEAYAFACRESQRFADAGNGKLARRYTRLREYMESRAVKAE